MVEFIDVAWSMTEVFCLLGVDDVCSVARNDESLGGAGNFVVTNDGVNGAGNFVATNDEFDSALPTQGLGFC
jgi:hypothetical protein